MCLLFLGTCTFFQPSQPAFESYPILKQNPETFEWILQSWQALHFGLEPRLTQTLQQQATFSISVFSPLGMQRALIWFKISLITGFAWILEPPQLFILALDAPHPPPHLTSMLASPAFPLQVLEEAMCRRGE